MGVVNRNYAREVDLYTVTEYIVSEPLNEYFLTTWHSWFHTERAKDIAGEAEIPLLGSKV